MILVFESVGWANKNGLNSMVYLRYVALALLARESVSRLYFLFHVRDPGQGLRLKLESVNAREIRF